MCAKVFLAQEHLGSQEPKKVTEHNKPHTRDLFVKIKQRLPLNGQKHNRGLGGAEAFYRVLRSMLSELVEKCYVAGSSVWPLMLGFPSLRLESNQGHSILSLAPFAYSM